MPSGAGKTEIQVETVFSCRFVATEFSTWAQHAGRIDTLGLSEDGNPVIVEYKKVESSELVNQSLYQPNWIADHRGNFELSAQRSLGQDVEVDWSEVRVICLAANYKKYDLNRPHLRIREKRSLHSTGGAS